MAMVKNGESKNGIINGLISISAAFKNSGITDNDIAEIVSGTDLLSYFEKVKDWRNPDMIRYRLHDILMMSFMIILSNGTNSFLGIANHIRVRRKYFAELNLIHDNKIPSHDTIKRLFETLDNKSLYAQTVGIFYDYLLSLGECLSGRFSYRHMMVDGKEIRGSGRSTRCKSPKRNTNVLNIYDSSLQTCIHSEPIDNKTNEIPTAQRILSDMDLSSTVLTADALHCQRETADIIHKNNGIYILCAKENQPLLAEEIISRLDKYQSKIAEYERGKRCFEILHLPKGYSWDGFTGMRSFIRVTSYIRSAQAPSVRLFISNTEKDSLICEGIENRWDIENGLHKEKDGFLKEDLFHSTDDAAIGSLAIMNNFAIMLVRMLQMMDGIPLADAKIKIRCETLPTIGRIIGMMKSKSVTDKVKNELTKTRKYPTPAFAIE